MHFVAFYIVAGAERIHSMRLSLALCRGLPGPLSSGATLGPAIGGLLTDQWGYRAAFYFCSAALLLVAACNHFLLPETRPSPCLGHTALWERCTSNVLGRRDTGAQGSK